jgi:hypothetical protein
MKNKIIKWRKEKLDFIKNSEVPRVVYGFTRLKISVSLSYFTERREGNTKDRDSKGEFSERLGSFRMRYRLAVSPPPPQLVPWCLTTYIFICDGQQSSDIEQTLHKFKKLQPSTKFTLEKE